ncbi:unnamed protein product, partial [Pelagomonas calceolata]
MNMLGNGLYVAHQVEDALTVLEAELATKRRLGVSEERILAVQNNLANTYYRLGQEDRALRMRQEVYSARLKFSGEEHPSTLRAGYNYADTLSRLERFEEAKSLLLKIIPVARRVLGENEEVVLRMRANYAGALVNASGATLDDIREAVTTLDVVARIARRVLGGAHPITEAIEHNL